MLFSIMAISILQSYSHQDSMVLAHKQKYRLMEQDRTARDKPTHRWALIFNKEYIYINIYIYKYIYNIYIFYIYIYKKNIQREKTASSISVSGKTGQLHGKE